MAYNDSGELTISQSTYSLGGYTFELKVQNVHEPGEPDVVSVFVICRGPDGNRQTQAMDFPEGTTVESWSVEANETEASIYVKLYRTGTKSFSSLEYSITVKNCTDALDVIWHQDPGGGSPPYSIFCDNVTLASTVEERVTLSGSARGTFTLSNYSEELQLYFTNVDLRRSHMDDNGWPIGTAASTLDNYSGGGTSAEETLIACFAINLGEAGGGPGGDWDEPGDVGPDPEKHYTLTVSVTGASSGSNSGIPLEAQEQSVYGSGGYGGNGGGGGAGASTVIIYDFATNKADNVVQEATAQGPGTGGPGGKGGKGGDGCILIFY